MAVRTLQPDEALPPRRYPLGDGGLTLREFVMREPLPLSVIQDAVFDFVRGREDVVVYGAQAVNAYVVQRRSTEDVDLASTRGRDFADELRQYLADRFRIAARVRNVRDGLGYRIYQVRKDQNRHLVDVRPVPELPPYEEVDGILVVAPPELIAGKMRAALARAGREKGYTDRRDLTALLRAFPELKAADGPVRQRLQALGAGTAELQAWDEIVAEEILPEDDDSEFGP
jgi:hypothetical protein